MREAEKPRPVPFRTRLLARLTALVVQLLCATLRLKINQESGCDRVIAEHGGGILVTWHGRPLIPIYYYQRLRKRYHMLVSLSRDGEFLSELFRHFGLGLIRGSTNRRGATAAREVLTLLENGGVLAFTPDGPRGPSHIAHPGVIYFAQRSGKPIIPVGVSAYPRCQTNSWDRFLIPLPFARARVVYGEPIFIRPEDDPEEARRRVELAITGAENQAESEVAPEGKRCFWETESAPGSATPGSATLGSATLGSATPGPPVGDGAKET